MHKRLPAIWFRKAMINFTPANSLKLIIDGIGYWFYLQNVSAACLCKTAHTQTVTYRHCCSLCDFRQFVICKRKLESKKEALLILSKELDTCQQERDQYKLMANQLRERHQGLKKKYRELIVSQHWGLKILFCWRNGENKI